MLCFGCSISLLEGQNGSAENIYDGAKHTCTHTHSFCYLLRRFPHFSMNVETPPLDPTLHSILHSALEFTQRSKNTAREEIPTFRSNRPTLQRHPNNKPLLTRNHPRQYRKTEASESCFSRIDCCVQEWKPLTAAADSWQLAMCERIGCSMG